MSTLFSILLMSLNTYTLTVALFLVLFIWGAFHILKSDLPPVTKLLWLVIIFFFPIIGLIVYILLNRK